MKRPQTSIPLSLMTLVMFVGALSADEHVRFPQDVQPDLYFSGGPIGSLHDDEWIAIPFPPELTRDEESKQRFVLEAQAASALDHPNICTINSVHRP